MPVAELSKAGIPFGTIIAFAGNPNKIPLGWRLCDGSSLDKFRFPRLFNAIGTVWGGSADDLFFIPDLRGMFLRGVSMNSGIDPDAEERISPKIGEANPGSQKNNVGSIQGDSFKAHHHVYAGHTALGAEGRGGNAQLSEKGTDTANTGGNETRPVNAYVNYIIKVDDDL